VGQRTFARPSLEYEFPAAALTRRGGTASVDNAEWREPVVEFNLRVAPGIHMSHVARPAQTGGLKQLYLRAATPATEIPYIPRLYVEARIDFADVRSGLNETCSVSRALDFYPFEGDDLWTEDMVIPVAPERIDTTPPPYAKPRELPPALRDSQPVDLEARLVAYLLRTYSVTLFRNPALKVYSRLSESTEDFCNRCLELLKGPFRLELDALLSTFNRSLEQIRERHLKDEAWTPAFDRSRVAAQNRRSSGMPRTGSHTCSSAAS